MIPRETIDRVFSAAKIEDVIGDYVTLKRRGANLIGLCPFHNEKTGSFTVSPSKGIYKCFGCGKAGNVVGFMMDIEQCSYVDAIKSLAKRYGIEIEDRELTQEERQRQDDRESMFLVNDFANKWFREQLHNTDEGQAVGMSYLRQRGLRDDTIERFQIGYSPEHANLWADAKKAGYVEKYLTNDAENEPHIGTGVCLKSQDGKLFDRFRGRVMFPFLSVSGKVVGFAGRLIKKSDKAGKYVNSPTSLLFEKHNELYGIYQAKKAITQNDKVYLVEGQVDVIQMSQSGIENVVASGGTSLTMPQVRLLHRYTKNVTILYDGDHAGIKAALRGIDMMLEEDLNVRVVLLPEGEDPDSFARSHNASDLVTFIQQAETDFIQFKMRLLSEDAGNDPVKMADMINQILDSVAVVPDIIKRRLYIKECSAFFGLPETEITRKVSSLRTNKLKDHREPISESAPTAPSTTTPAATTPTTAQTPTAQPIPQKQDKKAENLRNLIQVIIRYGELPLFTNDDGTICQAGEYIISELENDGVEIDNPLYNKIIDEYKTHYQEEGFKAANFFQRHTDMAISNLAVNMIADKYQISRIYDQQTVSENVVQAVKKQTDADMLPDVVTRLLLELKYTIVNERIDLMEKMLKEAQKTNDWELIRAILEKQKLLQSLRQQLSKELGNRVII